MHIFYRFVITCARTFFKLLFRNKVYRAGPLYKKAAIIAPNHTSFFDPPVVSASWPEDVHFLASDYLFKVPILKTMISNLNAHSVTRGSADLAAIRTVCSILDKGNKVIIFPEGSRSRDGKIGPIKPGIGLIVTKSKCAVIPTYVHGTFDAWGKHRKFPKLWGRTAVVFGTPILYEEFEGMDRKEAQQAIISRVDSSLHALEKWFLGGARGSPP